MKIVSIRRLEDCFDGTIMKEVVFEAPITKAFILSWESYGRVHYYPAFARPFFSVDVAERFIFKGVEGNTTARLILCRDNLKHNEKLFRRLIETTSSDKTDTP